MSEHLSDIVKFTPVWWKLLGEKLCNAIRARGKSGRGISGQFHPYSAQYAKYKGNNMRKFGRGANGKGAGERLKSVRGASIASSSTTPDMTLTNKMNAGLQTRSATKSHVDLGWLGINAGKVAGLADNGYDLINLGAGDPFAKAEMMLIEKELGQVIDKNIKKYCKTPMIITVAK